MRSRGSVDVMIPYFLSRQASTFSLFHTQEFKATVLRRHENYKSSHVLETLQNMFRTMATHQKCALYMETSCF